MVRRLWLVVLGVGALGGCEAPAVQPDRDAGQPREPAAEFSAASGYDPDWSAARSARKGPRPPHSGRPTSPRKSTIDDPLRGRWTLQQATATLPAGEQLVATITTSAGELSCQLWPDKAPETVALFIGLANGLRPWKTQHGWLRRPAFDGSRFTSVKPGPAVTLGPPPNLAASGFGRTIVGEPQPFLRLDQAGLLCLQACSGTVTELTVLITTAPTNPLAILPDAGPKRSMHCAVNVVGECGPAELLHGIAKASAAKGGASSAVVVKQARVTRK